MIGYGYSVKENDDPYVEIVEAAVDGFSETLKPGAFLADMIPFRELSSHHSHTAAVTPLISLFDHFSSSPAREQCDMYLSGSPERDGKSRPSDSRRC